MEKALALTRLAPATAPNRSHWHAAVAHQRDGNTDAAITALQEHLRQTPDDAGGWMHLGAALRRHGRLDAALVSYQRALRLCPRDPAVWSSMGRLWADLGQQEQGLRAHRRAVELDPSRMALRVDCAHALAEAGRLDEAERHLDSCLRQEPGRQDLRQMRGRLRLQAGRLREGWEDHEARPEAPLPAALRLLPRWRGERVAGRRVLVTPEGSPAETLWAARYVGMLARRGACVSLACEPDMQRVLASLSARIVSVQDSAVDAGSFDLRCPLQSLPALLDPRGAAIPDPFVPEPPAPEPWLRELLSPPGAALRVGIAWQDPAAPQAGAGLSLGQLLPLALLPHLRLYSLQTGSATAELPGNGAAGLVTDLGSRCADLADLASAIAQMDVCVLIDGVALHLAGCIGKPALGLLGGRAHWLHGMRGESSRWYPSLRLLRQESPGDWFEQLRETTALLRGWADVRSRRV